MIVGTKRTLDESLTIDAEQRSLDEYFRKLHFRCTYPSINHGTFANFPTFFFRIFFEYPNIAQNIILRLLFFVQPIQRYVTCKKKKNKKREVAAIAAY